MPHEVPKPIGIGRMIDLSFQLYRKHFAKLMSIMLICYGLFYLLQAMTQGQTVQFNMEGIVNYSSADAEPLLSEGSHGWVVFLFGLVFLFLTPVAVASVVFLVYHAMKGEEAPSALQLLRMSFKRYGGLLGSSVLFALMMLGFIIAIAIVTMILGMIVAAILGGVGIILVSVGVVFTFYYFVIRFMYFLPVVALQEESVGFGRSWSLTRQSFWRLFGLFLVMMLLIYLFNLVAGFLLALVPMSGIVFALLQMLVNLLTAPILYVVYAVSYFDLRVRDGMGLEEMINRIGPNFMTPPPPPADQ